MMMMLKKMQVLSLQSPPSDTEYLFKPKLYDDHENAGVDDGHENCV